MLIFHSRMTYASLVFILLLLRILRKSDVLFFDGLSMMSVGLALLSIAISSLEDRISQLSFSNREYLYYERVFL